MSHTTQVYMIADQEIQIGNESINIHNIGTIIVGGRGQIIEVWYHRDEEHPIMRSTEVEKIEVEEPGNDELIFCAGILYSFADKTENKTIKDKCERVGKWLIWLVQEKYKGV